MENREDDHASPFSFLPVELTQVILFEASGAGRLTEIPEEGLLCCRMVCRFVCRQWRQLLTPWRPHRPRNIRRDNPVRFVFADVVASKGWLAMMIWAKENGCPFSKPGTFAKAAAGGHLEVLKWMKEHTSCPWNQDTCSEAAQGGHLEVLKWAREQGFPWEESTCSNAAAEGHLEVLKWLISNGCPYKPWICRGGCRRRAP